MNAKFPTTIIAAGAVGAVTLAGCLPGAGLDHDKLIKTASFDHGCPARQITMVSEDDDGMAGTGRYVLEVCGENKRYKRAGTMYYDADKGLTVDGKRIAD